MNRFIWRYSWLTMIAVWGSMATAQQLRLEQSEQAITIKRADKPILVYNIQAHRLRQVSIRFMSEAGSSIR